MSGDLFRIDTDEISSFTTKNQTELRKLFNRLYVDLSGGGGVDELVELMDVDILSPENGDVLTYDSTLGLWINAAGPSAPQIIVADPDTVLTADDVGKWFTYDGPDTVWSVTPPDLNTVNFGDEISFIVFHAGYLTIPTATTKGTYTNQANAGSVCHLRKVNTLSGSAWLFYGELEPTP